jgi:hypothetical protein
MLELKKLMNAKRVFLQLILVTLIVFPFFSSNIVAANVSFSMISYQEWYPGNALGYPQAVSVGSFRESTEAQEVILISEIPEETNSIAILEYKKEKFEVITSFDRDCSLVYKQLIADFDGDGIDELLLAEEWLTDMGSDYGSIFRLYNLMGLRFHKNCSYAYYQPNSEPPSLHALNVDDDKADELVVINWNQTSLCEEISILDYNVSNEKFNIIKKSSFKILNEMPFYRKIHFTTICNLIQDSNPQLLTISYLIEDQNSNFINKTFEFYTINDDCLITHVSNNSLDNIVGSSLKFALADFNNDNLDELITYLDNTDTPLLTISEYKDETFNEISQIGRKQSDFYLTGWYLHYLFVQDLSSNGQPEIILIERCLGDDNEFHGRFEIYSFINSQFYSNGIEDLECAPATVIIGNIDSYQDYEIISCFTTYINNGQQTISGIELWTHGSRPTNNFQITESLITLSIIICPLFILIRKYQKNRKN